jgi:eukaryotic-like serine/threonine-protein kinase
MLAPGFMLGSYRIIALLGRGGMATVYEAYDTRLDRAVALKVLPPQFLHDERFARRFDQEARVIAKLEHPAIVPIYASGTDDGIPWMSMRLLGGGNMGTLLKSTPPDPVKALGILRRVAEALDYAHARGVVHRDIKPANILFDRDERACVGDFGLAHMLEGNAVATRTGTVLGTPHYMAPEQALGNRLDHRCDVYSLGIVAYEMLFGRTPFTGDSPVAVVLKHMNEPLPVPAASRLPDALLSAIQKAAAKDPLERWPSAGAFVEALETGLGVARISSTVIGRSADERAEQHSESRPGRLTIAAAAVLGTAALAWVLVMPPRESPGASPGADVKPTSVTTTEEPPPGGGEIPEPDPPATPPGVKEPNPPSPKTPPPPKEREADTTAESSPPNDSSAPEDTVSTLEAGTEVSSPSPEQQSNIQENKTPDADAPAERRGPVALPVPPVDPPPAADVIVLPSCIPVAPDYPGVARAAQLQGIVVLDVTVGADGTVRNVVVVKSPHAVLEDAARKAVMRYTCSPGRRNDVPEAMRIQQTVEFELR